MNTLNYKKGLLTALIATLGFVPGVLSADSLNLDSINTNYLQQVSITYDGNSSTVYAGGITGSLDSINNVFFCYDISHEINVPGTYTVNLFGPTASFPSYLGLPSTFNLQAASALLANVNTSAFTNVNQYSGLQLAIWSILYNWTPGSTPTTLNGPNFSAVASGALLSDAQAFLAQAAALVSSGQYLDPNGVSLLVNANDSPSDVIQTIAGVVAPEPSTYLILGSALMAAAICARRRQEQVA